jgi:hypothetical protein
MAYGWRVCSFHDAEGEGVDINGRTWRWEFSRQFGPTFLDKDGDPLRVQPAEKSPAWRVFNRWYDEWRAHSAGAPPDG